MSGDSPKGISLLSGEAVRCPTSTAPFQSLSEPRPRRLHVGRGDCPAVQPQDGPAVHVTRPGTEPGNEPALETAAMRVSGASIGL